MKKAFVLFLLPLLTSMGFQAYESPDYLEYHKQITAAEKSIGEHQFKAALEQYAQIFERYDFVFLRDYKVASQLALYLDDRAKAFEYIRAGMSAGWALKDIKKNKFLKPLQKDSEWTEIQESYAGLRSQYQAKIDPDLREEVHLMFKKDQKKAMGALLKIGNKAQEKYGTITFAPHSEKQMLSLVEIIDTVGYPGEKLIGNDFWMSTIISHHNSISLEYSRRDTLYNFIKPKLIGAIENGEMSPYEFALADDWQKAAASERTATGYGFLISPKKATLSQTDELRRKIGLRSIGLRNKLVEVEEKTGMNFYLPDWIEGKINIE